MVHPGMVRSPLPGPTSASVACSQAYGLRIQLRAVCAACLWESARRRIRANPAANSEAEYEK